MRWKSHHLPNRRKWNCETKSGASVLIAAGRDNALLLTDTGDSVVLIVVTGSLIFASHPAINSIGTTTLIGMSATLLITYTLQPALFKWLLRFESFRKRNGFIKEL